MQLLSDYREFPMDSNFIDVSAARYGASRDGITGDTAAIKGRAATVFTFSSRTRASGSATTAAGAAKCSEPGAWPTATFRRCRCSPTPMPAWTEVWVREARNGLAQDLVAGALVGPAALGKPSLNASVVR
jgi:hypothetical protein